MPPDLLLFLNPPVDLRVPLGKSGSFRCCINVSKGFPYISIFSGSSSLSEFDTQLYILPFDNFPLEVNVAVWRSFKSNVTRRGPTGFITRWLLLNFFRRWRQAKMSITTMSNNIITARAPMMIPIFWSSRLLRSRSDLTTSLGPVPFPFPPLPSWSSEKSKLHNVTILLVLIIPWLVVPRIDQTQKFYMLLVGK